MICSDTLAESFRKRNPIHRIFKLLLDLRECQLTLLTPPKMKGIIFPACELVFCRRNLYIFFKTKSEFLRRLWPSEEISTDMHHWVLLKLFCATKLRIKYTNNGGGKYGVNLV